MKKILILLIFCYSFAFSYNYQAVDFPRFWVYAGKKYTTNYEHQYSNTGAYNETGLTGGTVFSSPYCFNYRYTKVKVAYDPDGYCLFTTGWEVEANYSCDAPNIFNSDTGACEAPVPTCNSETEVLNPDTNECDCKPTLERKADGSCGCPSGFSKSDAGNCCDAFNRDTSYAVSQAECGSEPLVQIDNLTIVNNFIWNECLNICTGTKLPGCSKGKVYDSNGYCVAPMLDDNDCVSAGGTLAPYYSRDAVSENTIINFNVAKDLDKRKCHNIAICKASDGSSILDDNGEIVYSSAEVSCGPDSVTTPPNDNEPDNRCTTCPTQYPIPTDAGSCANANGETTYCPTSQDGGTDAANDSNVSSGDSGNGTDGGNTDNDTNNISCGTCSLLGGAISTGSWSATAWIAGDNGLCKRTTINGITQISICPTAPQTDNNISITPSDGNATLKNGETDTTCPCCPEGTKSTASGKCLKILSSGSISMMVPCPCDTEETPRDGNSTEPLDNNGTDDNATGLQNDFGHDIEREIKKAYKGYEIFNTSDCGELSVNADAYIGNPEASISDPLPIFRDVISPYRDIIKNFLMFMAVIIGLFDFFKRS